MVVLHNLSFARHGIWATSNAIHPGERENEAQYTFAAMRFVMALTYLRSGHEAADLFICWTPSIKRE